MSFSNIAIAVPFGTDLAIFLTYFGASFGIPAQRRNFNGNGRAWYSSQCSRRRETGTKGEGESIGDLFLSKAFPFISIRTGVTGRGPRGHSHFRGLYRAYGRALSPQCGRKKEKTSGDAFQHGRWDGSVSDNPPIGMRTSYTLAYSPSRFDCIQVHPLAPRHTYFGCIFRSVVINNAPRPPATKGTRVPMNFLILMNVVGTGGTLFDSWSPRSKFCGENASFEKMHLL